MTSLDHACAINDQLSRIFCQFSAAARSVTLASQACSKISLPYTRALPFRIYRDVAQLSGYLCSRQRSQPVEQDSVCSSTCYMKLMKIKLLITPFRHCLSKFYERVDNATIQMAKSWSLSGKKARLSSTSSIQRPQPLQLVADC